MGILFGLCLLPLVFRAVAGGTEDKDYMSRDMTSTINGYFLTTVFMTHIIQYIPAKMYNGVDWVYLWINRGLGQLIVAMFLFYSGYGVMQSIRHKSGYMRTFIPKRVIPLLFDFEIAVCIYFVVSCMMDRCPTIPYFIKSMFAWESLGNSNWYIFAILYLYLLTYVSFRWMRDEAQWVSVLFVLGGSILYIWFMQKHKGGWWYDTILCYVAGMCFSYFSVFFRRLFGKKGERRRFVIYMSILLTSFVCLYLVRKKSVWWFELLSICFCLLIVLLTSRFHFFGKIYSYIGKNLFCFYMYQRIPMIVFQEVLAKTNIYLYFFICAICTGLIAYVMIQIYEKLHQRFFAT